LVSAVCILRNTESGATDVLSVVIPIPRTKITSYRIVIIMRLIILALFFNYRITHPVDSAYGLWLTSVICEIWFAVSWVLDQFPKWSPINRETYIDRLSARLQMFYNRYMLNLRSYYQSLSFMKPFIKTMQIRKRRRAITACSCRFLC